MLLEDILMYGKYGTIILAYFCVASVDELTDFNPTDDGDEVWELPPTFNIARTLIAVETEDLSIGNIYFGVIDGHICVAEQNASPLIFYKRKVD